MKVLFCGSECVPFVKTGGLADVMGALPPVLKARGVDVRVMLPLYQEMPDSFRKKLHHLADFEVELGWRKQYCGIESMEYGGVTFYFVDNRYYFGRPYVYGLGGDEYERYCFFCRAVLNALPLIDFQPDVLHCHDWQAGMIPALHKIQYQHIPFYANMRSVQTIHNLQYQGIFGVKEVQDCLGLGDSLFTYDKLECFGMANFLKSGLVYADAITTVSESYAEEIQTAYYGERLEGLLRARRSQLHGLVNGIDIIEYNPADDVHIAAAYDVDNMAGKAENKAALQREMGLAVDPSVPLVGMVTRLSGQKGLDLVDNVIRELMDTGIQLAVLGKGDSKYVDLFSWAENEWPGRVSARFEMNSPLAHRIYAGADMFLMPSSFEPCGLSQMISMRYGTVPIVRETGGLRDTVLSYNPNTGEGNGFTFFNYNAHDMLHTLERAVEYYLSKPDIWQQIMRRGMSEDFSWDHSAARYAALYEALPIPVNAEPPKAKPKKTTKAAAKPAEAAQALDAPAEAPKKRAPRKKAVPAPEASAPDQAEPAKAAPKKRAPRKTEAAPQKPEA